jgi:hypothetical protein
MSNLTAATVAKPQRGMGVLAQRGVGKGVVPSHSGENGLPSSPISENTAAADRVVPHLEAPASAGHAYDVFAEYEKTFGADSSTRKPRQRKERNSSSSHGASPVRDKSLSLNPLIFPLSLAHPSTQTLPRNLDLASTVFKHDSGTLAFA